jgi:anti-anti-sigma factor
VSNDDARMSDENLRALREVLAPSRDDLLSVTLHVERGVATIRLAGEADVSTTSRVADAVNAAVASNAAQIEVDCSALTFIDLAAIRPLLAAQRRLAPARGLWLVETRGAVELLLSKTGLDAALTRPRPHLAGD